MWSGDATTDCVNWTTGKATDLIVTKIVGKVTTFLRMKLESAKYEETPHSWHLH